MPDLRSRIERSVDQAPPAPARGGSRDVWPPRDATTVACAVGPLDFEGRGRTTTDGGEGRDAPTPAAARSSRRKVLETDTQTDMLPGKPRSAICVQRFDDSLSSAIHTTYRTWLRSSSMHEPRDPPLKVISFFSQCHFRCFDSGVKTNVEAARRVGLVAWRPPCGTDLQRFVRVRGVVDLGVERSVMILPQVHLRKPCYDFYFL